LGASFLLPLLLFQTVAPAEDLQRGKNAFDRGEFKRAVEIVRPLLYPELRLQSDSQIVLAHRILGVSYLFERQQVAATGEFRKLLQLIPDYRFDPLLDPPEVVDFFNSVRKDYGSELARLEARRKEAERARLRAKEECEKVRAGPTVVEKRVGRNSFAVNFLPFGAGQFQNGQRGKGWAFLTAETVLGAVSVGAFATNLAVYGLRPQRSCRYDLGDRVCPPEAIDHTDENRSRWLTRVQVASGALFLGTLAWGILDAIYNYRPETQLSLATGAGRPLARGSVRLSPAVMERAIGPALSFRF
jgi:hypothetical protein